MILGDSFLYSLYSFGLFSFSPMAIIIITIRKTTTMNLSHLTGKNVRQTYRLKCAQSLKGQTSYPSKMDVSSRGQHVPKMDTTNSLQRQKFKERNDKR